MRLLFKQRLFSWLDSYDIYNEAGEPVYTVQGQLAWGHCLKIFDVAGRELGTVKEKVFTVFPTFEIYLGEQYMGCINKEFSFLKPRFNIECNGWTVDGNWLEWDYRILDPAGREVAVVSKELFHWADTYVLDITQPQDALCVLMLVLAIDAEKCSRS